MGKSKVFLVAVALLHNADIHVNGFNIGFRTQRIAKRVEGSALLGTSCPPAPLDTQKEQAKEERLYRIEHENNEDESTCDNFDTLRQSEKNIISLSADEEAENDSATPSAQSNQEESATNEESHSDESDSVDADDTAQSSSSSSEETTPKEKGDLIARAALLNRRLPNRSPSAARAGQEKRTSVGLRRVGSASKARQAPGSSSKVMDALRKAARGASTKKSESENEDDGKPTNLHIGNSPASSKVSQSKIQSAIGDLLHNNLVKKTSSKSAQFVASVSNLGKSVGLLGNPCEIDPAVLSAPLVTSKNGAIVRLATPMDDLEIANLRLSVFSDFSPSQRGQFCARSCDAISNRRKRGAMCIIATQNGSDEGSTKVYGTAEISDHEFHGTQLGKRRPRASILYVTEVAVHPAARRRGYGSMLFGAIDEVAKQRKVETVYLHVDVCNTHAIDMYEKCGYAKVDADESVFEEFTRSLNLHPGATKGRTHHLLFKDISQATWLPQDMFVDEPKRVMGSLGFDIPA